MWYYIIVLIILAILIIHKEKYSEMKRFFVLFIPLIMIICVFFSGCSLAEADRSKELDNLLEFTYKNLSETFAKNSCAFSSITEYLSLWAENCDISITDSSDSYIVLTNASTNDSNDTTAMHCFVDTDDPDKSLEPLAIGITALLGPEQHGSISLIVTEKNNGEMKGANAIPSRHCNYKNFINLHYSSDVKLLTSGAYEMIGNMTSDISMVSPAYSHAFAITMKIPEYTDPFTFDDHYPNPIEVIGNLLATEKSSGKLFQIASFEYEKHEGYTPYSATAIVVVDENNVTSFTNKFEKSHENMAEKFEKLDDDFVYTLTETKMPKRVMNNSSGNNLISLMYTLKAGVYMQDEDSGLIMAASDISSISTSGGKLEVCIKARALNHVLLEEMSNVFLTTSGLCDINYNATAIKPLWTSDDDVASFFRNALTMTDEDPSALIRISECDIFTSKNKRLRCVSYYCNMDKGKETLNNLLAFMQTPPQ